MNKTLFELEINISKPAIRRAVEIAKFRRNDLKKEADVPRARNNPIQFLFPNSSLGNLQMNKKRGYITMNPASLRNFFVPRRNSRITTMAKNTNNLYLMTQENLGI